MLISQYSRPKQEAQEFKTKYRETMGTRVGCGSSVGRRQRPGVVSHICNRTLERLARRTKSSRPAWAELDLVSKSSTWQQQPQQNGAKEQGT